MTDLPRPSTLERPRARSRSLRALLATLFLAAASLGPVRAQDPDPVPPGTEALPWAVDWKHASTRAGEEKKLVVVLVELYAGIELDDQLPWLFLDPDLADLMRERFVLLQWKRGMKAPFQSPEVYGMGPSTFGGAVLFATPEGHIVGQTITSSTFVVDEYARAVLARCPEAVGTPVRKELDDLSRADAHLKRGELSEAELLLDGAPRSLWGNWLRASLFRRLRRGEEAIAAMEAARGDAIGEWNIVLLAEEGILRMRMGQPDEAGKIFASVVEDYPESQSALLAKYWMARVRLQTDVPAGKALLEEIVATDLEGPWSAHATMLLESGALERYGESKLEWPVGTMMEVVREVKPQPVPPDRADSAERDAIAALLKAQMEDGTWITPYQIAARGEAFRIAATSICGLGLMPHRSRKEVAAAVDRALGSVLASVAKGSLVDEPPIAGIEYSNWGRLFALRFLARCTREGMGPREKMLAAMGALVEALDKRQTRGGGWSYYGDKEASFMTAAAALALIEAKESGAEVPESLLKRTMKCLRNLGAGEEGFLYMKGSQRSDTESALRGPLCSLALFRGGEGTVEEVRSALDRYLECRLGARRERGKALCHTAPDAVSAYYLLFGYAFAAEAVGVLPEAERAKYRNALLEDVLAARLEDGCFLDFPATGRFYGTGMALIALRHLGR